MSFYLFLWIFKVYVICIMEYNNQNLFVVYAMLLRLIHSQKKDWISYHYDLRPSTFIVKADWHENSITALHRMNYSRLIGFIEKYRCINAKHWKNNPGFCENENPNNSFFKWKENLVDPFVKKNISPAGNRTPVSRVTGGDTYHYTTEDWL